MLPARTTEPFRNIQGRQLERPPDRRRHPDRHAHHVGVRVAYADATTGGFNRDGHANVALNYRDAGGIGRVTWFKGASTGLTGSGAVAVSLTDLT
ncbi:hypothetical protein [Streptomyces mirabilis]|uniref:hypothetical protein n=1 Tax=Streptomyces mirabilis TaxID=68239 RepID=UPI00365D6E41